MCGRFNSHKPVKAGMVEEMLLWIQLPLLIVAAVFVLYLCALTVLAAMARRPDVRDAITPLKFACIVPAHNEELSIGRTIRSILSVQYPADLRDVYVVADNCTDATGAKAEENGAFVLRRSDESQRGKGYALRWAFDRLLNSPSAYEAFVVIDADSVVSSNFLRVVNATFQEGGLVVQARDVVERNEDSWSTEMTRIGFLLFNVVRPLGRSVFRGSAGLRGNGMCFRSEVLRQHPWTAFSVSEDAEYGLSLLLRGIIVGFAPEAEVLAMMPSNPRNAESQRARWEGGRLLLMRRYGPSLLRAAIARRSIVILDALLDLLTPAVVNLIIGIGLMVVLNIFLMLLGSAAAGRALVLWSILLGLGAIHVLWGLRIAGADASTYRSLANVPRYAVWKIMVYIKMLGSWKHDVWTRTTREDRDSL
jgi:1,2-diacylglycerol 3-beta-glucosyltransferase